MRLTLNEYLELKRRRPGLFGLDSVPSSKPKRSEQRKPQETNADKEGGFKCVVISLVGFRHRLLDSDNFASACKILRDQIANSLNIDDGDKNITWQYGQVHSTGEEGVLVRIELMRK
jgi:hypothetical protein